MPLKNKKAYNSYMNEYMKNRWEKRRLWAVEFLGGKCVICGSTSDLEFDHMDPQSKYKTIARLSSASNKIFKEELAKCQLLCSDHHLVKTLSERKSL